MAQSIGPILATGLLATANRTVFNSQPMDWRILPATGLAAVGFSLMEKVMPRPTVVIAWTAFATILLTRINNERSPVENALAWWNAGGK